MRLLQLGDRLIRLLAAAIDRGEARIAGGQPWLELQRLEVCRLRVIRLALREIDVAEQLVQRSGLRRQGDLLFHDLDGPGRVLVLELEAHEVGQGLRVARRQRQRRLELLGGFGALSLGAECDTHEERALTIPWRQRREGAVRFEREPGCDERQRGTDHDVPALG